jgi:hypothetical protein
VKADQVDIDPRWATSTMAGGPITVTEVQPAGPVKDNLVAFTRATAARRLIPSQGKTSSTTLPFLKPPSNRPSEMARWSSFDPEPARHKSTRGHGSADQDASDVDVQGFIMVRPTTKGLN